MEHETDPQLGKCIAVAVANIDANASVLSYLRQFQAQKEIIERQERKIEALESKLIKVHGALGEGEE